jgi:ribA/ribD-fused uncharacterized protein
MNDPIYFFTKTDPYYELSNFSPHGFEEDGLYWPTVEHYFQAQKFNDSQYRERIRNSRSPKDAKSLGQSRKVPLRNDWEQIKEDVMLRALRNKFSNPKLNKILLGTEDRELVEKSPFDYYWGCGWNGSGKNRLGYLLMQVREELKTEDSQ